MLDTDAGRWNARPLAASTLRVVALVLPVSVALVVTWAALSRLPEPTTLVGAVGLWLGATLVAFLLARALEPAARRLLPLASALRLSLAFPDQAPSRLRSAFTSSSEEELARLLERAKRSGFSSDPRLAVAEILTLTRELDRHDEITRGHGERVRTYTRLIAEEMGLGRDQLERLQWVGLLHDIGKLAVPCAVLNKPGRLDASEWAIVRQHPEVGARMVEPLRGWLGDLVDGVGQHHERWDGDGYPAGISGADISLAARIVAVADVYDVITASRSYKEAQTSAEALAEITRCAGTQFDERVVRALLAIPTRRLRAATGPLAVLAEIPLLGPLTSGLQTGLPAIGSAVSTAGAAAVATGAMAGLLGSVGVSPALAGSVPGLPAVTSVGVTADDAVTAPADRRARGTAGDDAATPADAADERAPSGDPAEGAAGTGATTDVSQDDAVPGAEGATASGTTESAADAPVEVAAQDDVLASGQHSHVIVTSNDTGIDGSTVTVVQPAAHAEKAFFTVTGGGDAMLHYHAGTGYSGPDEMVYRGCDSTGTRCVTATIRITVESPAGGAAPTEPSEDQEPAPAPASGDQQPAPEPSAEPAPAGTTEQPPASGGKGGGGKDDSSGRSTAPKAGPGG